MARYTAFELTVSQTTRANVARRQITELSAHNAVTVAYVKRDGTDATLTGSVIGIVGTGSHEAVKVETANGPRSANLWSINSVSKA